MTTLITILQETIMITGFVMVMMLIIEFLNVRTHNSWSHAFDKKSWKQYLFSGLVGVIPGCLGPYLIVTLYTHNLLSFGALLTAFIATTGDESFMMLSLFPAKAIMLSGILLISGIVAGFITDKIYPSKPIILKSRHVGHDYGCVEIELSLRVILRNLRDLSFPRAILIAGHLFFLYGIAAGYFSENSIHEPLSNNNIHIDWISISFGFTTLLALFVVTVVPDHFLEEHLWGHIIKRHFPRIFLWTLAILISIALMLHFINLRSWISSNMLTMMFIAILIGIIPVSGPHLIFVTLFAQGILPFHILLLNSIVQEGHGSLPLIAESKRSFIKIKIIKVT